ncbi:hypothetical protein BJAS_P3462 [Bathymodiolus japonicus methanotrophic gill symbiont]|nr:hypothetical protein BJAS_P3462 [Bathymodiolus japonicus methanotrophic gill symbiont]
MKLYHALLLAPCISHAGMFIDRDDIGNLSYLESRHLSHTTCRFLTQDSKKQYSSHYNYGSGNIITHSDPTGNMIASNYVDSIESLTAEMASSEDDTLLKQRVNSSILYSRTPTRPY